MSATRNTDALLDSFDAGEDMMSGLRCWVRCCPIAISGWAQSGKVSGYTFECDRVMHPACYTFER